MSYAATVMFAIQAGVRLYGASRKAYADSVRGEALMLPLPRSPGVKAGSAETWFLTVDSGKAVAAANPRIALLATLANRNPAQVAELVDLYRHHWSIVNPVDAKASDQRGDLGATEMHAFLEVRQWSSAEAAGAASPIQTIAGTLVNIAVDYFATTPGAVSEDRPEGRALKAFLEALDKTNFATVPPKEIASGLMVAVLDTVSAHPGILSGGENEQKLITGVTKTLAESATAFLKDATDAQRRDAGNWMQLIGHAVLKGAAETVLAEPGRYLKIKPGAETGIVSEVGKTFTNLLLGDEEFKFGDQALKFRDLFSADGLDKVAKSALSAVGKNPEILRIDNKGVENVVVALAQDLAKLNGRISPDIFPEVVRLVLDKSGDNLDLIWGKSFTSPKRHLLVTAVGTLMKSIAKPPPAGSTWKPQLTPGQIVDVTSALLDEVIENPGWVIDEAGQANTNLKVAVEAMLDVLRRVPGNRVSAETGIAVLRAGIGAVALRFSLLEELPPLAGAPARVALNAALDAIFGEIFAAGVDAKKSWDLARNATLVAMSEVALDKLARIGAEQKHVDVLRKAIQSLMQGDKPFDRDAFAKGLEAALLAA